MANPGTLHDAFIDELRDAYDGERQLTKALPKLAKTATSPALRDAFETHLEETQEHIARLEEVFEGLGEGREASTATASPASSRKASPSWKRISTTPRWTPA